MPPATCSGVSYDQVRGPRPVFRGGPLRRFAGDRAVCSAYWVAHQDEQFVPQSLEIDGSVAYVAGYRWARRFGNRPCQIAVVDLRSGRTTAFLPRFQAPVYHPTPTFCRHGGGMEQTPEGLWVVETQRLWLLDPAKIGHGDPVKRWWRIARPVKGSSLVIDGRRLGVVAYTVRQRGKVVWFGLDALLAAGVNDLRGSGGDATDARALRVQSSPPRVQGATAGPGGIWFSSSTAGCGQLTGPKGQRIRFVPGAEDIEFTGRDLWTVSEAGARPYLGPRRKLLPVLFRLDRAAALRAAGKPCW